MPSADFRMAIGRNCLRPSPAPASGRCLFSLFPPGFPAVPRYLDHTLERTTSGSPGVNTYLCAHGRRVYLPGLRWIEDFALCCRLIPPGPPDSVLVHRPMRLRHPALAGRLPPEVRCRIPRCAAATSFASIKLDQGLAVGEASHAEAHPLEYVPCPAHNKSVKRTWGVPVTTETTPRKKKEARPPQTGGKLRV